MSYSKPIKGLVAAAWLLAATSMPALAEREIVGSGRTPNNTMLVKIDQGGGHMSERIVLSLDKSAVVELPANIRDIMVANPEIADAVIRTPRRVFVLGKKVGQTNIFFMDPSGKQILNLELQVERDLSVLERMYSEYLPNARIKVAALNDKVILSGFVSSAAAANQARNLAAKFIGEEESGVESVVNMLTIDATEQVMLKVRIVEMQRNIAKQFGVSWDAYYSPDGDITGFSLDGSPITDGDSLISGGSDNPFSLLGRALSSSGFGLGTAGTSGGASATLNLMERVGLVKTLAEPTLTAISGEAANFLAGGEFPVPTGRDRDGNIVIDFKEFGVGLGFTPLVMSEGRISMRISTEVSELTTAGALLTSGSSTTDDDGNTVTVAGINIPALRVRRAETTVELPSGGSLIMAGLLQENMRQNIDGLPGAKDVPILGALFRSRDYQSAETELVIIVTPYLVRPVSESEIQTPIDGFAPPSDLGTILLGRLNTVYSVNGSKDTGSSWRGPVGHIVE